MFVWQALYCSNQVISGDRSVKHICLFLKPQQIYTCFAMECFSNQSNS
jgi:hypothetical protein